MYFDEEREKCERPIERWLYDSLKQRGFVVEAKVPCGPFELDVSLPEWKIAFDCKDAADEDALQKTRHNKKMRYLKLRGWRILKIRPRFIYRDFQNHLRTIEMLSHN
ncbi:MAG TPA: hypothetical protein VFK27_01405 [Bacillales bacterium]|nr:hypothetical protein [Bacillales bacterium]